MNERWPTEKVPITCRPIAAPMNHGAPNSTVERTFSNPKRCATAAPRARSYTRSTTGTPGWSADRIHRTPSSSRSTMPVSMLTMSSGVSTATAMASSMRAASSVWRSVASPKITGTSSSAAAAR